jgi:uncharacterized protein (TIGR03083 family)
VPHVATSIAAATHELDAFAATLRSLDAADLARPTPCPGWTVADLAGHVATGAFRQAEAFHRARVGATGAPGEVTTDAPPDRLAALVDAATDHLRAAVEPDRSDEAWAPVPLPFATLPAPIAAAGLLLEYGVHHHDLQSALHGGEATLSTPTSEAILGLAPLLLPTLAPAQGPDPIAYRLRSATAEITLAWTGTAWQQQIPDGAPTFTVEGPDEAIALLAMRRTTTDDARLTVDDPTGSAGRLPELLGAF